MKTKISWILLAGVLLLSASCTTARQISYLRDVEYGEQLAAHPAPELRLQPEDRISIQVFSSDAELAAPFNTFSGISQDEHPVTTAAQYTIDRNGNIDFPVLGTLHVEGLTLREVKEQIGGQIAEKGFIREPILRVELENFQVTYLGERTNGILEVENESLNLLEAMAQIGSLSAQTKFDDIMVIRTENGVRQAYSVNLQTKEIFDSPVFYLQQNDIIYIKPRGLRRNENWEAIQNIFTPFMYIGTIVSQLLIWAKL